MKNPSGRMLVMVMTLVAMGTAKAAQAQAMSQPEFFQLVGGTYRVVAPAPEELLTRGKLTITEREGTLYVENLLRVGTKNLPATYRVGGFNCYVHQPLSTSCDFYLQLVEPGAFVHFLGVSPTVRVDRGSAKLRLEIRPGYVRAGEPVPARTIVEKLD